MRTYTGLLKLRTNETSYEKNSPSPDGRENPFVPVPKPREPQKIAADSGPRSLGIS
jgi:hypothetical protein